MYMNIIAYVVPAYTQTKRSPPSQFSLEDGKHFLISQVFFHVDYFDMFQYGSKRIIIIINHYHSSSPSSSAKLEFNIVLTVRQKWHWDFWHFVQNTWGIEANLPDGRAVKISFRLAVRTMPVPTQTSPSTLSASQPNATWKKLVFCCCN